MKKLLILLLIISSCSADVSLIDPISSVNTYIQPVPDYNFIATPYYGWMVADKNLVFQEQITLYLRPFENVNALDTIRLSFSSNKYARLIIPQKDTLLNNDKIFLRYKDFQNYRLAAIYQSGEEGLHTLNFNTNIRKVTKEYKCTINTK